MSANDELAIKLSKGRIILLILGSCAFVAVGVWMFSMLPEDLKDMPPFFRNLLFIHTVGILSIVFFGMTGVFGIKKFFDRKAGLVFNSAGIFDNSSGISAGYIPWTEILGTKIYEMVNQKMLIILLANPDVYIERGNPLKRFLNRKNYNMCGSPISISSNALKMSFPELLSTFERYHQKYGQRMSAST